MENVSGERAYLRERRAKETPQKVARRRETMEIRRQGREKKEGKNVVSRTEVVVQDENVTSDP